MMLNDQVKNILYGSSLAGLIFLFGAGIVQASNPVPNLQSIFPNTAIKNGPAFTIHAYDFANYSFVNGSFISFNGTAKATTFVSARELTAAISSSDISQNGSVNVTVNSPTPGGGVSNVKTFTIYTGNGTVPTISSISPSSAQRGAPAFTMTVNNTDGTFKNGASIYFNGSQRITNYISDYQITADILASDIAEAGIFPVVVVNSSGGGQGSSSTQFNIEYLPPVIASISPASKPVGSAVFTISVNGNGFVAQSTVMWGNSALPTTYVSPTLITGFVSNLPPTGTYAITVTNPVPGGGTSNSKDFAVTPVANNLLADGTYCPVSENTTTAIFSWDYSGINTGNENQFQIQIDDNSNFSSPAVNRTFDDLSNPPGSSNQQSVFVTTSENDSLIYNKLYYWRVKVWQETDGGGPGLDSEWVQGSNYVTIAHAGPYALFSFSPSTPNAGALVLFTNNSICYATGGSAVPCQSYYWDFGDNGASTLQSPSHSYNTAGTFNVALKAYDELGYCQANQNIAISKKSSLPFWREINPFNFPPLMCKFSGESCASPQDCCSHVCLGIDQNTFSFFNNFWLATPLISGICQ